MKKYAILLGSAPEDFRQKKIEDMFNFLDSKRNKGDSIVTFANGISEMMLEMVMDNSLKQLTEISEQKAGHSELDSESINARHSEAKPKNLFLQKMFCSAQHNAFLLYICTLQPVGDGEKSFWLGGEEIRRDVILHYQKLAAECGVDLQVVMDSDSEMESEEELGWENMDSLDPSEKKNRHSEFISESIGEIDK